MRKAEWFSENEAALNLQQQIYIYVSPV